MASSVVAEKRFVWKFIDEVTQGVNRAKNAMKEAEASVKGTSTGITESSNSWKKLGANTKEAADKSEQVLQKNKESLENYRDKAVAATKSVTNSLNLYSKKIKELPAQKKTNIEAKVKDSRLKSFSERIKGLPPSKRIMLDLKGNYYAQMLRVNKTTNDAKKSLSDLKKMTLGTMFGNAALNSIYAVGNAFKGLIATGLNYNREQQTMIASWKTLTGSASEGQKMVDMTNKLAIAAQNSTQMVNDLNQKFYAVTNNAGKTRELSKSVLTLQDAFNVSDASIENFSTQWSQMVGNGKASAQDMLSIQNVFPKFRKELLTYERQVHHNKNMTMKDMNDLMSQGKISSNEMNHVLISMGHKYRDATKNFTGTLNGMGRVIRSTAPRLAGALTEPFTKLQNPIYKKVSDWVSDKRTEKQFKEFGEKLANSLNNAITVVANLHKAFEPLNRVIGAVLKGLASGIWRGFTASIKLISNSVAVTVSWLAKLVSHLFNIGKGNKQLDFVNKAFKVLGTVVGAALGPVVAIQGALLAFAAVSKTVSVLKNFASTIKLVEAATKAWTLAQTALDVVLNMNPIGLIVIGVTALIAGLVLLYKKCKPFREFVNGIGKKVTKMVKDVIGWFKKIGKAVGDSFTGKAGWEKNLRKQYQKARKEAQRNAKQQANLQKKEQMQEQKQWQKHWKNLQKGSSKLWQGFAKNAKNGMKNIQKEHDKWSKNFKKSWNRTWTNIGRFTNRTWQTLRKNTSRSMGSMHASISVSMSKISNVWNSMWSGLRDVFKNIWDTIKQIAQDGINAVISVINGGIGAIDKVWSFFTGHGSGIGKLKKAHFATGGTVGRALSVVNDGPGDDWKELMQFPDGSFGMSQKRNATLMLPVGTRVYSGPETKAIMSMAGIDHYATGGVVGAQHFAGGGIVRALEGFIAKIGDAIGGIGERFAGMEDYLEAPVAKVKSVIQRAVGGNYSALGHWGELAHGEWNKITDGMKHWVQHTITQFLYSFENQSLSKDMMRSAATINKLKPSDGFFGMLWQVIMSESGGRNILQQIHDVNSGGNEAGGILQFTPGTFAKYALPGHGERMNDFNQLLAFFNNTDWLNSIGSTIIRGASKIDWLHSGPQGGARNNFWPKLATGGEVFSEIPAIIGDNPEHHEFVINPYAPSAKPLLAKAFEATENAQGGSQTTASNGNSKLDQMVDLLAQLVALVGDIDPQIVLDGDALQRFISKKNAQRLKRVRQ